VVFVDQQVECEFVTSLNTLNDQQIIVFIGGHSSSKNSWKVRAYPHFHVTAADTPKYATAEKPRRKQARTKPWISVAPIVVETGKYRTAKPKPDKRKPGNTPSHLMLREVEKTGDQILCACLNRIRR